MLAGATDSSQRAQGLRLRGAIEYFTGAAASSAAALLEAVELLEPSGPQAAVATAADAVNALVRARAPDEALKTARRAPALAPEDGSETDFQATATLGYALCFVGRYAEAEPHLRRAVELLPAQTRIPTPLEAVRLAATLAWLGRYEDGRAHLAATVARARAAGAVGSLPYLLAGSAWLAFHASRWNEAEANAGEAYELAEELGQPATAIQALGVLTWVNALRGDEARTRGYGDETRRRAAESGYTLYGLLVSACLGLLHLGAGRIAAAIDELEAISRYVEDRNLRIPGSHRSSTWRRPTSESEGSTTRKGSSRRSRPRSSSRIPTRPRARSGAEGCMRLTASSRRTSRRPSRCTPRSRARSRWPAPGSASGSACGVPGGGGMRASSSAQRWTSSSA